MSGTGGSAGEIGKDPDPGEPDGGNEPGGTDGGNEPDGGSAPVPPLPTRWLAYNVGFASYLYDLDDFAVATPIPLGNSLPRNAWSPDGRRIIYGCGAGLCSSDVSGDVPGPSIQLGDGFTATDLPWAPALSWSADSASLAYYALAFTASAGPLSVFDPSRPAPLLHPVSAKVRWLQWAPRGSKLLYADDQGTFCVVVTAGVPGTPAKISGVVNEISRQYVWSPDAAFLAHSTTASVELLDMRGAKPLATLAPGATWMNQSPFNVDGTRIALGPNSVAIVGSNGIGSPVALDPAATEGVADYSWVPGTSLLEYSVGGGFFATDVSQGAPGPRKAILLSGTSLPLASPNGHVFVSIVGTSSVQFDAYDIDDPGAGVTHLQAESSGPSLSQFSNGGESLAYWGVTGLKILSVSAGPAVPVPVTTGGVNGMAWAPNDAFFAFTTYDGSKSSVGVLRVQGTTVSSVLYPSKSGQNGSGVAFQP